MLLTAESGNGLYLAKYGIGQLYLRNQTIYFGFKETEDVIDSTEEVTIHKQGEKYLVNGEIFTPVRQTEKAADPEKEIRKLPVTEDLRTFALTNLANIKIKDSKQRIKQAIEEMEKMVINALVAGVEIPPAAIEMLAAAKAHK